MPSIPFASSGGIIADPVIRYTSGGDAWTTFTLIVGNRKKVKNTEEWEDATPTFFKVTCWKALAEHVAESCRKGSQVVVTGSFVSNEWTTEGGEVRTSLEVNASDVGMSMKYREVTVSEITRENPEPPPEEPKRTRKPATPAAPIRPVPDYYDEEPF